MIPFNVATCQLVTDDGVENYGVVSEFLNESKYPSLKHLVAHKNMDFSNSMIEYTNKRIKYDYLYRHHITDIEELNRKLKVLLMIIITGQIIFSMVYQIMKCLMELILKK